ncbi:MAG: outer membrane lipid asymmetry maintenance protein MlaD [Aliidongia sp.]
MNRNVLETVMGALVLAVAVIFLAFAYSSAGIRTVNGYELIAKFDRIDGIKTGADVRVSGIKVGTVTGTTLDPKTFQASVRMTIDSAYPLPVDTVALITSNSLLGDDFMKLLPGNDDKNIPPGGSISNTVPPTDLWQMLSQMAFSMSGGSSKPADGGSDSSSSGSSSSSSAPADPAPSGPTPSSPPAAGHKS